MITPPQALADTHRRGSGCQLRRQCVARPKERVTPHGAEEGTGGGHDLCVALSVERWCDHGRVTPLPSADHLLSPPGRSPPLPREICYFSIKTASKLKLRNLNYESTRVTTNHVGH